MTDYHNAKKNFNNIKCVWYTEDYVYYFRNTLSKYGRLTFQKKLRIEYETPKYAKLQREEHAQLKDTLEEQVLIFEKEAMRFEESGARLFEKVYKYKNVYYVLRKDAPMYNILKTKYGNKIVTPDSKQFIKLLHTAKYYIGTELPIHMIGVRSPYKSLRYEIMNTKKHKFIFLQHGITQALSLSGEKRKIFRKKSVYSPYKVIVSSQREADHFVESGEYEQEDLWNVGLATFDNKKINAFANKITIMLTWRPWDEYVITYEQSSYYNAVLKIFNSIDNKKKLQIILHPKVANILPSSHELSKYIVKSDVNTALNNTRVLITDYSSASFDAFYRGSNIIFWWEERDKCLEKYKNYLILNDYNVFGDVSYSCKELNELIKKNKNRKQKLENITKYRKFVQWHDNKNIERLLMHLKIENIFHK